MEERVVLKSTEKGCVLKVCVPEHKNTRTTIVQMSKPFKIVRLGFVERAGYPWA